MTEIYAFIRVSTEEQNVERQLIKMAELGIPKKNMVVEKESGKSTVRTKYQNLVKRLKAGDILYIENIDRLGRDYDIILEQWHILTKQKKVIVKVLDTPSLDTDIVHENTSQKFTRDVLFLVQAYQAHSEWDKIKSRQAQGIAVAKAKGKNLGRPKKDTPDDFEKLVSEWERDIMKLPELLDKLSISKSTFYRRVEEMRDKTKTEVSKGVPFDKLHCLSVYEDVLRKNDRI